LLIGGIFLATKLFIISYATWIGCSALLSKSFGKKEDGGRWMSIKNISLEVVMCRYIKLLREEGEQKAKEFLSAANKKFVDNNFIDLFERS